MKNFTLFVILTVFVLVACGTPAMPTSEPTLPPAPTNTLVPPPTATLEPSPTPTPIPLGGGGTILMGVNQLFVPKEMNADKPFVWLSSLSDGSRLSLLNVEVYNASPYGKRMIVRSGEKLALMDTNGEQLVPLNIKETYLGKTYGYKYDTGFYYAQSVLWLANGKLVFLATDKPDGKSVLYIVDSDGNNLAKLEQPSLAAEEVSSLLFSKADGSEFYWVTGKKCNTRGICVENYYLSKIDGSNQQQVWQEVKNAGDNIYLSPSGKYIAYSAYFGQSSKNGCYLATTTGELITKLEKGKDLFALCNRENIWSPSEDKILMSGWEGTNVEYSKKVYIIWSAPNGETSPLPDINSGDCRSAHWLPDGQHIFFENCTGIWYQMATDILGQRKVNITTGDVTEYPSFGFCEYVISPNAQWALFYACENKRSERGADKQSQLLNLETKEVVSIYDKFTSTELVKNANERWTVFWIP
jgi:hypothetical protein